MCEIDLVSSGFSCLLAFLLRYFWDIGVGFFLVGLGDVR